MNGILICFVLIACFVAGAEAKAPGVTAATITAIDEAIVAHQVDLKPKLEDAIARHQ